MNTEQVLACDGALLLARNLSSPNSGVKQNVAGALRIFLETNFGRTPPLLVSSFLPPPFSLSDVPFSSLPWVAVAYKAIRDVEGIVSLLAMLKEVERPQLQSNAAYCILLLCTRSSMFLLFSPLSPPPLPPSLPPAHPDLLRFGPSSYCHSARPICYQYGLPYRERESVSRDV